MTDRDSDSSSERAAHTPGPWSCYLNDEQGFDVYQDDGSGNGDGVPCLPGDPQSSANAHLIAAAPELLSALEGLLPEGWGDGTMDHMPGVLAARAAIAKARGEAA